MVTASAASPVLRCCLVGCVRMWMPCRWTSLQKMTLSSQLLKIGAPFTGRIVGNYCLGFSKFIDNSFRIGLFVTQISCWYWCRKYNFSFFGRYFVRRARESTKLQRSRWSGWWYWFHRNVCSTFISGLYSVHGVSYLFVTSSWRSHCFPLPLVV